MKCPKCGSRQTGVRDSRHAEEGRRRRYECLTCGCRFNTMERYAPEIGRGGNRKKKGQTAAETPGNEARKENAKTWMAMKW